MTYDSFKHHRHSIRLKDYDYTQAGAYFVTVCAENRECLFGEIVHAGMRLNEYGKIVRAEWLRAETVRPNVALDEFVIMPNHIHGIILLTASEGANRRFAPTGTPRAPASNSIGAVMMQFKSIVTKRINKMRDTRSALVWQRSYYEHIVRSERELERIRAYIVGNPAMWHKDENNPAAVRQSDG